VCCFQVPRRCGHILPCPENAGGCSAAKQKLRQQCVLNNNNKIHKIISSITTSKPQEEMAEEFYVQSGEAADLSTVRATSGDSLTIALQQLMDEDETILFGPSEVQLIRSSDEEENAKEVVGTLLITTMSILFWATDKACIDNDLVVPAVCIDLHAMAEDPVSVYIQIRPSSMSYDEPSIELTILSSEEEKNEMIFAALCKLVSLHPVDDGEDDDEGFGQDDEMIVRSSTPPPATEQDRESMLEYLDSVLVVPPELEIQEQQIASGQFDDADDDDDAML
jgi:hypothetical protein